MNPQIDHETARGLAITLVNIISPCLRPEEQHEAVREFYEVIRERLSEYRHLVATPPNGKPQPGTN
jgi:hypothetical protein